MNRIVPLLLVCALTLAGCTSTTQGRKTPALSVPRRTPTTVIVAQAARPGWTTGPEPTLVSVVRLDGRVATLTVATPYPYGPELAPALSPDGQRLLYVPFAANDGLIPSGSLRVIDLESKADTVAIPALGSGRGDRASRIAVAPRVLAFGWDEDGGVIALSATVQSVRSHGPGSPDTLSDFVLWRGEPGRVTSEAVSAESTTTAFVRLLAANRESAWFLGETRPWLGAPDQHLLRYDFVSRKLTAVGSVEGPAVPGVVKVGDRNASFLLPPFSTAPTPESLLAYGIPVARTETHRAMEYFETLLGVDVHGLSDFHTTRSVPVTSGSAPGNYVESNVWGLPLTGGTMPGPQATRITLPTSGDWGLPVFDPTYSRYLRSRAVSGGAELNTYDAATGKATAIVHEPDPFAMPLGYIDTSGTVLYTGTDTTTRSVVRTPGLFLFEPGRGFRLLARLPLIPPDRFPVFHPSLLGVRYAK